MRSYHFTGVLAAMLLLSAAPSFAQGASERDRKLCLEFRGEKSPLEQRVKSCAAVAREEGRRAHQSSDAFRRQVDALVSSCHTNRLLNKIDLAEKDCLQAFATFDAGARVWGNSVNRMLIPLLGARGALASAKGEFDKALADEDEAVNMLTDADFTVSYLFVNRGLTRRALKQYDAALEDFEQAIGLDDRSLSGFVNRGVEHKRRGRRGEAKADFEQALKLPTANDDLGPHYNARAKRELAEINAK